MDIGKTLYVTNRKQWRAWLAKHHQTAAEIWLIYYGWIDSLMKPIDARRYAQRFSPRKPKSNLSDTNRERVRRLITARRRVRIGWIVAARPRREVFEQRLRYFIRMTKQGKRFGMVQ